MAESSSLSSAAASTSNEWRSTLDAAQAAAWLRRATSAIVLTHAKPDGDAAGSTLAIARSLRACGISATAAYVGPAPRWLSEIAGATPHVVLDSSSKQPWLELSGMNPDVVVVTDTGSWSQLAEVRPWLEGRSASTLVIDHHLHGDAAVGERRLLGLGAASATLVLAPVCCGLLGLPLSRLPVEVAEPIYLGLATDTQWFKLSNVSPAALRVAGDLLEAGAEHTRLYELIEQQDTASRWMLAGKALSSLELHDNGRVAIMRLSLRDFAECGADRNDTSGFADMVLRIASVQVAIVLTEASVGTGEPATTKVSMRSKPGPRPVDVNAVTMTLGGGGHARAAGAKMIGATLDEAAARVLGALAASVV